MTGVYDLSLSWDTMNRITARDAMSQDAEQFGDISWSGGFDERGRLDWEGASTASGERWSLYDYAEPGWLTSATSSENSVESSRTWTHDAGGRRETSLQGGVTEHTLGWDGSALTDIDGASLTLDPFDAVIEDDRGFRFTRDPSGALIGLDDGANTVAITRDPDGFPIANEDADGLRLSTWISGDLPLEVEGADGATALHFSLGGIHLGQLRDGAAVGVFEDARGALLQLGSEILPNPGPFGESATLPTTLDERFLFGGLEAVPGFDGVLLARHRELDTRTGAWLSPDPLGLAGGGHRQRYAEGDPLGFVDPLGLTAGPAMAIFGASTSNSGDRFDSATPSFGSLASASGGVWDPCAASPETCGGQQAGGRRFILNAEDDPDAEVDAGKSAWRERREERQGQRQAVWDNLSTRDGLLGRIGRMMGGQGQEARMSFGPYDQSSSEILSKNPVASHELVVRVGLFERLAGRWQSSGGFGGWWDRTFPEGRGGASAWNSWRAWTHGRDATLINLGADNMEATPFMMSLLGHPIAGEATAWGLDRTNGVGRTRDWALSQYKQGLALNEQATDAGATATFAATTVASALTPTPGLGAGGRVLGAAADDTARLAARTGDEVIEAGVEALARVGDDVASAGLRTDPTEVLERYAGKTGEMWTKPNAHHPIPMGLGGFKSGQTMYSVEYRYHKAFHSLLNRELKARGLVPREGINASKGDWERYFRSNPGTQQEVYAAGLDAARAVDARFGTEFATTMQRNIDAGLFDAF